MPQCLISLTNQFIAAADQSASDCRHCCCRHRRMLGLMEHAAAAAAAKVGALKKQVAAPIVALKTAPLGGLPKAVVPPMMRRGKPLQVRQ